MRHLTVRANAEVARKHLPRDALAAKQDTVHFNAKNGMFVEVRLNSISISDRLPVTGRSTNWFVV